MHNQHKQNRILTPQTPGVNPTPEQMPPQEGEALQHPPEIQKLIDDAKAQAVKEYRRSLRDAKPESDLPEQSEIDASTITRAVLTRDGYVCPKPPAERKGPLI